MQIMLGVRLYDGVRRSKDFAANTEVNEHKGAYTVNAFATRTSLKLNIEAGKGGVLA